MLNLNIRILLHEQYFLHKIEDRTIISCVSLTLISSDDFDRDLLSWKLDFRRVWVFLLIMSLLQTSFLELQDRAHGWTHVRTACAVSNVVPIKEGTRNSLATEITSWCGLNDFRGVGAVFFCVATEKRIQ